MTYASPKEIMDEIASLTPSYGGIRYDRLETLGLQWPCPTPDTREHPSCTKTDYPWEGKVPCDTVCPAPELPDEKYPFLLTTDGYFTTTTRS